MRWMRNHSNWWRGGIAALVLALSLSCLIWACAEPYQQKKAVQAETPVIEPASGEVSRQTAIPIFSGDTVTYQGKRYRRNTYVKSILCIGVDRSGTMTETTTHGFGGQADGLFLIAQDTARGRLRVLMIPRDTMTDITLTDLSGNVLGKGMQHLNLAFAYGDGRDQSCKYMLEAVSGLLEGLKIDWYLAADMEAITVLNDQVGGVAVTILTDGMQGKDPAFVKGDTVTLKGKQAEEFVRFRDIQVGHSALFRMNRQQQYIKSFFDTVQKKAKGDKGLVVRLFDKVTDYMVTDMTKDQYLKIGAASLESDRLGDDDFYTVPGKSVITSRYDEFYADEPGLIKIILKLFYREAA